MRCLKSWIIVLAGVSVLSLGPGLCAYGDELSDLKAEFRQMRRQMEAMQKKIEQLEKDKISKTQGLGAGVPPVAGYELGEGIAPLGQEKIRFSGFGSISFENSEDANSTFKFRHFNLYADIPINQDFKAFGEIEFEDGGVAGGSNPEGQVKAERFWLNWNIADWANIRFGKIINPFDEWNILHADPLLLTTTKPLLVNNGRMMSHMVGVTFLGSVFPKDWEINYYLGVSNGSGPAPTSADNNENKMFYGRAQFVPPLGDKGELKVGLSAMTSRAGDLEDFLSDLRVKENMLGADLIYHYGPWGVWADWYQSWIDPTVERNYKADGFFVMGTYKVTDKLTALVRYEENDKKSTQQVSNFTEGSRWLYGINYKITPPVVFKLEYITHSEEVDSRENDTLVSSVNVLF